jgi:hypothetical protein
MRPCPLTFEPGHYILVMRMERRKADARPLERAHTAPTHHDGTAPGVADALIVGWVEALTPSALLNLQKTAGNASIAATMVQRAPAATRAKPATKHDQWADMVAMHVEMVLGSSSYSREDTAGIPDQYVTFLEHLSQALYGTRFGARNQTVNDRDREADLSAAETMLAGVGAELMQASGGPALFSRVQGRLSAVTASVTQNAVAARAFQDADFAAALQTREVMEAKHEASKALEKTQDVYSKFSKQVENLAGAAGHPTIAKTLEHVHGGIEALFGVIKASDRETYTKAMEEAREWVELHDAGAVMGTVRATVLVAEITEVTAGTVGKVVGSVSKLAVLAFIPKGSTLKELEELSEAGKVLSKGGKIAVKLGKVIEIAEKLDGIVSMVNIVGGVAKFVTADTGGDKIDAVVKVGTGVASLGAKALGEAAAAAPLAAGAFAVGATWEMTKFFGEMGLDAIEGSLYGGLYQELKEIEPDVDNVAKALLVTERAIDERDKRFGDLDVTDPRRAGADDAIEGFAYQMQKKLRKAAIRWQNTTIPALYRDLKYGSTTTGGQLEAEVANVLGMDYHQWQPGGIEAGMIATTAGDFVREFRKEWKDAPFTVLQMAVDQGYMTRERASQMGAKLAKAHKE